MRIGSGKIYVKTPLTKQADSCLSQITNNIYSKSQARSDKTQKITQIDSASSKHSQSVDQGQNMQLIFSNAIKEDNQLTGDDPTSIVRKLSSLNTIFKQLKMLKEGDVSYPILRSLSRIQDKFIGIQREILKNARLDGNN